MRCGHSWDGISVHYCANFPKHGERVQRVYRAELPSALDALPQAAVETFQVLHGIKDVGLAKALLFIEGFAPR